MWAQAADDDVEITRLDLACDSLSANLQAARTSDSAVAGKPHHRSLALDPSEARPESKRSDDMSVLLGAATRRGLDVASVRYQWLSPVTLPRPTRPAGTAHAGASDAAPGPDGEMSSFVRERADIAMSGDYAAFRAWLEEMLNSQPTLGLAAVHLRRKDSTTSTLAIDVSVDMGYRARTTATAQNAATDRVGFTAVESKR
jgi:hypothetical protein